MTLATPDVTTILPSVAALLVEEGNPAGHAAAVIREFSVPTLFQIGPAAGLLREGETVSVDASRRQVFRGARWDGIRDRVLARIAAAQGRGPTGPLHDLVLALHLTDPYGAGFKPRGCRSVHDVIRYIHEMSIRSMFELGDRHNRFWSRRARRLALPLPIRTRLIDMDGTDYPGRGDIRPEAVASAPFQALWRGMTAPGIDWSERWIADLDSLPPEVVETMMAAPRQPRRRGDDNYVVVARDYLNWNARMTFHYAMIDAVVGPGKEGNHVHFRARGGGADDGRRALRARFLELALRCARFVVDRQGDLVSGWLRGYPQRDSEEALAMLGRLLACNRRLDMLMVDERSPRYFLDQFLAGNYGAFARAG
jgi:pyruvate,water dikinase